MNHFTKSTKKTRWSTAFDKYLCHKRLQGTTFNAISRTMERKFHTKFTPNDCKRRYAKLTTFTVCGTPIQENKQKNTKAWTDKEINLLRKLLNDRNVKSNNELVELFQKQHKLLNCKTFRSKASILKRKWMQHRLILSTAIALHGDNIMYMTPANFSRSLGVNEMFIDVEMAHEIDFFETEDKRETSQFLENGYGIGDVDFFADEERYLKRVEELQEENILVPLNDSMFSNNDDIYIIRNRVEYLTKRTASYLIDMEMAQDENCTNKERERKFSLENGDGIGDFDFFDDNDRYLKRVQELKQEGVILTVHGSIFSRDDDINILRNRVEYLTRMMAPCINHSYSTK